MAFFKRQKYVRSSITVDICTRIRQATKIGDIQLEDLSLSLVRSIVRTTKILYLLLANS
jgi:hypothetical protein